MVSREDLKPKSFQAGAGSCKFCWGRNNTDDNPLIQSCECKGGVQFVHYKCLKVWITTRLKQTQSPNLTTFTWSNFECEICNTLFPFRFRLPANGRSYSLLEYPLDKSKNYILLESMSFEHPKIKTIYLLTPPVAPCNYKIGRLAD